MSVREETLQVVPRPAVAAAEVVTVVVMVMSGGSVAGGWKRRAPEAVSLANSSGVSTSFLAPAGKRVNNTQ